MRILASIAGAVITVGLLFCAFVGVSSLVTKKSFPDTVKDMFTRQEQIETEVEVEDKNVVETPTAVVRFEI